MFPAQVSIRGHNKQPDEECGMLNQGILASGSVMNYERVEA